MTQRMSAGATPVYLIAVEVKIYHSVSIGIIDMLFMLKSIFGIIKQLMWNGIHLMDFK